MQWYPKLDTGTEKSISGKTDEIQISSILWLIVLYQG